MPEGADPSLLSPEVQRELRSLGPIAERVATHLVAAGLLIDEDPSSAYAHAVAAKDLASRVAVVREAVGTAAYAAGDYAAARAELRAARRMNGAADHLALLADCERALGHPERALTVANDPGARTLDSAGRVELAIVVSGARRDLGQAEAAVVALQVRELDSDVVEEWSVRLWYAYAEALLAAGRRDEAREWFQAAATFDDDEQTDAAERLAQLSER